MYTPGLSDSYTCSTCMFAFTYATIMLFGGALQI